MIFRQMFEPVSCTYSYLIASRCGGEALMIDPVLEKVDRYLQLMRELDLHLNVAVPANMHHGLHQEEIARRGWAFSPQQAEPSFSP